MSGDYKDRFTEADKEQQDKSAFVCESCKTRYSSDEAKSKDMACCGRTMSELHQEGFGP